MTFDDVKEEEKKKKKGEDFYIVAPSDADDSGGDDGTSINKSALYSIKWRHGDYLDSTKWKVALVEASFCYPKFSLTKDHHMQIHERGIYSTPEFTINIGLRLQKELSTKDNRVYHPVLLGKSKKIEGKECYGRGKDMDFEMPLLYAEQSPENPRQVKFVMRARHRFTLEFDTTHHAQYDWFGLKEAKVSSVFDPDTRFHTLTSGYIGYWDKEWEVAIQMQYFSMQYYNQYPVYIKENQLFKSSQDMALYFVRNHPEIFTDVKADDKGLLEFHTKKGIVEIIFKDDLKDIVGLENGHQFLGDYTIGHVIKATNLPILEKTLEHLYIYSNISQPINVGGSFVSLLKALWIDSAKKHYIHGDIVRIPITNPMYLPITNDLINKVDIIIRNSKGKLVHFPDGSITTITLHFKDYD